MTVTGSIPAKLLAGLAVRPGDALQVLDVTESDVVVAVRHREPRVGTVTGAASTWLRESKGIVSLAPGETVDDARFSYLREKHGV
jgi:hypothetical protein